MTVSREMPRYQCHKQVWALKIKEVAPHENPDKTGQTTAAYYGATIVPADDGYGPFVVDAAFCSKHKPEAGGYYVVYDDGYKSFSPAKAFEEGYALMLENTMSSASTQPPTVNRNNHLEIAASHITAANALTAEAAAQ